jgi:rfaE bifunctional protein nucleotidyltransferase chain/domain
MELALFGQTSEDVAAGLRDGTFGMVRETGACFNQAVNQVVQQPDRGMGDLLAQRLTEGGAPNADYSILVAAQKLGVPVTVHVAVGSDIVHMHPSANGAALGQATFNDFRLLAAVVGQMSGGVYLNIGSAVLLPEVFLKALTIAQNLGAHLHDFVTVNMDMLQHYRPGENVVRRPATLGRAGYTLIGRHEIMVPLLAQAVVTRMEKVPLTPHPSPPGGEGGTGPCPPSEERYKRLDRDALVRLRDKYHQKGQKIVWTNGCFDLLHAGHVRNLQAARKLGDVLVVGVNSDDSVRQLKGAGRPIVPAEQRAEILAALEAVDYVIVFDEPTPEAVLRELQPAIHCKGADYAPPQGKPIPEAGVVAAYGGRIEFLPLVTNLSTTELVRRIQEQSKRESS